jgi:hypothetical protein
MTISRGFDPSGAYIYTDSATGQSTSDSSAYDAQQAITPDNLSAAYQQVYGTAPTQDWLNQTQTAYNGGDVTKVLQDLGYSKATSSAANALGIDNKIGSDATFASGASALEQMGAKPDPNSPIYQGVPTTYTLNGQQYIYGNTNNGRDASSLAWLNASQLPSGVSAQAATPVSPQDWSNAEMFGLGALGLGGAAAFAPALAGASGAEAFPVTGGSLIPGTELGAAGVGGLTASQALTGIKGAGALASLLGGTAGGTGAAGNSNLIPSGGTLGGGALPGNLQSTALATGQVSNADPFANIDTYQQLTPELDIYPVHAASGGSVTELAQLQDVHPKLFQTLTGKPKSSFFTYGSDSNISPTSFMGGGLGKPNPGIPISGQQPTMPANASETQRALAMINGAPLSAYAHGGDVHIPEFITGATGHYVKGKGTGQSDEIPAMLADGEWVFDADTVAQLGDGSSDAGAHLLDEFRKSLREHKRSAPADKIPPKASPLTYMKEALHRTGRK